MADGTFSIRRRQPKAKEEETLTARLPKKSAFEALLDGDNLPPTKEKVKGGAGISSASVSSGRPSIAQRRPALGDANEMKVESKRKKRLRDYDKMLKAFKYSAALDLVLKKVRLSVHHSDDRQVPTDGMLQSIPPTISFSLITELIHQDALRSALSGRDDVLLEPILHLLVRYISDPRFGELACDVATIVLGASFSSY